MFIKFGWGKNLQATDLKYDVADFNVSLSSSEEYGEGLGNCLPGQVNVRLEIPASYDSKPAQDIFQFAKTQHSKVMDDGAGKIVVYREEKVGQYVQEVDFSDAWIADISTGASMDDNKFDVTLNITAAKIKVSDVEFVDARREKLVKR
jgi:hypothetical protein